LHLRIEDGREDATIEWLGRKVNDLTLDEAAVIIAGGTLSVLEPSARS
jgi:hypothetical protein